MLNSYRCLLKILSRKRDLLKIKETNILVTNGVRKMMRNMENSRLAIKLFKKRIHFSKMLKHFLREMINKKHLLAINH